MNEFSAHADQKDLIEYALNIKRQGDLEKIFVVHGEQEQSLTLQQLLKDNTGIEVIVPERGGRYTI